QGARHGAETVHRWAVLFHNDRAAAGDVRAGRPGRVGCRRHRSEHGPVAGVRVRGDVDGRGSRPGDRGVQRQGPRWAAASGGEGDGEWEPGWRVRQLPGWLWWGVGARSSVAARLVLKDIAQIGPMLVLAGLTVGWAAEALRRA